MSEFYKGFKTFGNKDCRVFLFTHCNFQFQTNPDRRLGTDYVELIFIDNRTFVFRWDRGIYEHTWGLRDNETLLEFVFKRADYYYIVDKFSYGKDPAFKHFDSDKCKKEMIKEVLKSCREKEIDQPEARIVYEAIKDLEGDDNAMAWYYRWPEEVNKFFQNYDYGGGCFIRSEYSEPIVILRDFVLPALREWFVKNVDLKTGELKNEMPQL